MTTATVTRWWLIRHAPVTTHGGRIYGNDDYPADCSDALTMAGLAALLPPEPVWVTTQLQRTAQTAAAIAAARGAPPPMAGIEADLAEQHFGDWQGLTHEQLASRRDGAWHRFWLAPAHEVPPGGESFEQVVERVGRAMARLTTAWPGRDIVAVAHGGSIRAALAVALEIEPERALAFAVDNCSLTRIDHIDGAGFSGGVAPKGSWRVGAVNLHPRGLTSPPRAPAADR